MNSSIEMDINDFEMVGEIPNIDLRNGIQRLFDEITEKDNTTSELKRTYRNWKRISNELCIDCIESIFRCYYFGTNEFNQMAFQFKEKYSEQLNGNVESRPDIETGTDRRDDMQRS